ncbi:MAG: excalibur calcium-binding domain-containing protein [Candidatus Electrothrix sp. GW3-4]|uniref:excalibur calcium-binding domain-containing protein n=1 Tax=Candidatus Electrothrix sp. GW3-4 TaxID=3126740 RepID=UPI0030D5EA7F
MGKAVCSEKNMVVGYDLGLIRGVEIIEDGRIKLISQLTPDLIARINSSNQRARDYDESLEKIEQSKIGYFVHKLKPVRSVADLQNLGERQYQKYGLNGALHLFLPFLGALLVLIGSLWFIIAAFRVHIFWGLGCLLLPLVPLFFLFLHWRAAAKPFVVFVLGGVLACSGVYYFDEKEQLTRKKQPAAAVSKKIATKQVKSKYSCQGKTRCGEMRSCEEAKFYLKHCPGTKMDGDHDGIPCERQWCK